MGTDAQTQEGDRKGPVRMGEQLGWAAEGCPGSLPWGHPSGPLLSSLPQASSLLQSSQQHMKAQVPSLLSPVRLTT